MTEKDCQDCYDRVIAKLEKANPAPLKRRGTEEAEDLLAV
jgi:hypothetical protein